MSDTEQTPTPEVPTAETATPAPKADAAATAEKRPNRRKVREGTVVSDKMHQTIVVAVVDRVRHARYAKTVQRTTKLYAQDDLNDAHLGDRVRVQETRPLSKLKRWRLLEVTERAK